MSKPTRAGSTVAEAKPITNSRNLVAFFVDIFVHLSPVPKRTLLGIRYLVKTYRMSCMIGLIAVVTCIALTCIPRIICVPNPKGAGVDTIFPDAEICLTWQSYWAVALFAVALLLMANNLPSDLVMLGFTVILGVSGTITRSQAWRGFSEPAVLVIGALFVLARCLEETKAVEMFILPMLGKPKNHFWAVMRLSLPVGFFSAFMNNTPIVAMLMSVVERWAMRNHLDQKALLMPLSFSSMLGGVCTLIGTSTNLVLNAIIMADTQAPMEPLTMFSQALIGIPAWLIGSVYMAVACPYFLIKSDTPSAELRRKAAKAVAAAKAAKSPVSSTAEEPAAPGLEGPPSPIADAIAITVLDKPIEKPRARRPNAASFYSVQAHISDTTCPLIGQPPSALVEVGCIASFCEARVLLRGTAVLDVASADAADAYGFPLALQAGDCILLRCMAEAIPALRAVTGIRLSPEMISGANVKKGSSDDCLVEVVVAHNSPLDGVPLHTAFDWPVLRSIAIWGVRQPPHNQSHYVPMPGTGGPEIPWHEALRQQENNFEGIKPMISLESLPTLPPPAGSPKGGQEDGSAQGNPGSGTPKMLPSTPSGSASPVLLPTSADYWEKRTTEATDPSLGRQMGWAIITEVIATDSHTDDHTEPR